MRLTSSHSISIFILLCAAASPAAALDPAVVKGLRLLDMTTRLEQRCDIEAMDRIARDEKGYRPDRIVAAATADTRMEADEIEAGGAAVRSKGMWYRMSYVCRTSDDHMQVLDFSYEIGEAIPESDWENFGLFD